MTNWTHSLYSSKFFDVKISLHMLHHKYVVIMYVRWQVICYLYFVAGCNLDVVNCMFVLDNSVSIQNDTNFGNLLVQIFKQLSISPDNTLVSILIPYYCKSFKGKKFCGFHGSIGNHKTFTVKHFHFDNRVLKMAGHGPGPF